MLTKCVHYIVALMVFIGLSNAIYYTKFSGEIWDNEHSSIIKNFEVKYDESVGIFPDKFYVQFVKFDVEFDIEFTKSKSNLNNNDNVYVIDSETGNLKQIDLSNIEAYEHYEQKNGNGFATLIKNHEPERNNKFRMIGTIYSDDKIAFDVVPVVVQDSKKRKRNVNKIDKYDSFNNHHLISKRSINKRDAQITDFLPRPSDASYPPVNNPKSVNKAATKPFNLYVELLGVADYTTYSFFKTYTQITNDVPLFTYMRIYYAHVYKMVNYRYACSLQNDPDLRINVLMSNLLILNTTANQAWLNNGGIYNGRKVMNISDGLTTFNNFLNTLNPPLNYDTAFLLTNVQLLIDGTGSYADRSGVLGVAYVSAACSSYRYGLVEETGSLYNVEVVAHELGHILGSDHDGEGAGTACSASAYNIMTPAYGYTGAPYYLLFSSCSIAQFKTYVLTTARDAVSTWAQCLTNVPTNLPVETTYVVNTYPGQIWSADDQCRMYFGANASFYLPLRSSMCTGLACYTDLTRVSYDYIPNAAEGTTCDSGKICINNTCVASSIAPTGTCLYEDQPVFQSDLNKYYSPALVMPKSRINCTEAINLILSSGKTPYDGCLYSINSKCCGACASYKSILPTSTLPLRCPSNTYICQNGGTCVNTTTSSDGRIAFKCNCPAGFTGEVCHIKVPCSSNPCKNGGTCMPLGSLNFFCSCQSGCSGIDCSSCVGLTTLPTTTSTIRTSTALRTTTSTRTTTTTRTSTSTRTTTTTRTSTSTRTTATIRTTVTTRITSLASTRTTTCSCKCG